MMDAQFLLRDATSPWPLTILLFAAIMLGVYGERWRARSRSRAWRLRHRNRGIRKGSGPFPKLVPATPVWDAAHQLRQVMEANFTRRRLLNKSETRVFAALERAVSEESPRWRVMAQVSLGEILASPNEEAYRAINSKRVDFLLIDEAGMPLHAIEYQGAGHHQGSAAARDAVKREALRRAEIGYIEVMPGDTPSELKGLITKLVAKQKNGSILPA